MALTLSAHRLDMAALETPLLVVPLAPDAALPAALSGVDGLLGGALTRSIARRDFRGGRDEILHFAGGARGPARVFLVGLGKGTDRRAVLRRAGALVARRGQALGVGALTWFAGPATVADVEAIGTGLALGCWEYTDLKTAPPPEERRTPLAEATIHVDDPASVESGMAVARAVGAGHDLARRLGMMPGNVCTPDYLAETAQQLGRRHNIEVAVLGRRDPDGVMALALANLVTPMTGTNGQPSETPLEVIVDAIADVNRASPGAGTKLLPEDYANMANEISEFLLDPQRGLEQFYAIVRNGTEH